MAYDDNNVFARILRRELPCRQVYASEHALAFHDINPLAPTHVLVVPRGPYATLHDMTARAGDAELADFLRAVAAVAKTAGAIEPGYRILANNGPHANQEVPHLHMHVFAGRPLGPMLLKRAP